MDGEASWQSPQFNREAHSRKGREPGVALPRGFGRRAVLVATSVRAASSVAMVSVLGSSLLSGCMALALAPAVVGVGSMVSGSLENVVKATIDEKTFTPEVHAVLANAKTLAIVAGDRSSIKAADLLESRGGYRVIIDRPTAKVGEMTGSERRDALRKLCASSRADAAMMSRTTKTETGHMMMSVVTGRAKVKQDWVVDLLACPTNTAHSFGGTLEFDGGVYNQKVEAEYEEMFGAEIGGKILEALEKGKARTASDRPPVAPATEARPTADNMSPSPQPIRGSAGTEVPSADSKLVPMSVMDMQRRLLALGYAAGTPDGVMGRRTVDALKKFQRDNKMPESGRLDDDTAAKLGSVSRVR